MMEKHKALTLCPRREPTLRRVDVSVVFVICLVFEFLCQLVDLVLRPPQVFGSACRVPLDAAFKAVSNRYRPRNVPVQLQVKSHFLWRQFCFAHSPTCFKAACNPANPPTRWPSMNICGIWRAAVEAV